MPWIIPLLLGRHVDASARSTTGSTGCSCPGGVDLHPSAYHEEPTPLCGRTDPDRDETELTLTRWAMEDKKPLLAVCRGSPGRERGRRAARCIRTSRRSCPGPSSTTTSRARVRTPAICWCTTSRIPADTRLGRLLGRPVIRVNSMHHQGIKQRRGGPPAQRLRARRPDRGPRVAQRALPARRPVAPGGPGGARSRSCGACSPRSWRRRGNTALGLRALRRYEGPTRRASRPSAGGPSAVAGPRVAATARPAP